MAVVIKHIFVPGLTCLGEKDARLCLAPLSFVSAVMHLKCTWNDYLFPNKKTIVSGKISCWCVYCRVGFYLVGCDVAIYVFILCGYQIINYMVTHNPNFSLISLSDRGFLLEKWSNNLEKIKIPFQSDSEKASVSILSS